jgi:hypothetical protein
MIPEIENQNSIVVTLRRYLHRSTRPRTRRGKRHSRLNELMPPKMRFSRLQLGEIMSALFGALVFRA